MRNVRRFVVDVCSAWSLCARRQNSITRIKMITRREVMSESFFPTPGWEAGCGSHSRRNEHFDWYLQSPHEICFHPLSHAFSTWKCLNLFCLSLVANCSGKTYGHKACGIIWSQGSCLFLSTFLILRSLLLIIWLDHITVQVPVLQGCAHQPWLPWLPWLQFETCWNTAHSAWCLRPAIPAASAMFHLHPFTSICSWNQLKSAEIRWNPLILKSCEWPDGWDSRGLPGGTPCSGSARLWSALRT